MSRKRTQMALFGGGDDLPLLTGVPDQVELDITAQHEIRELAFGDKTGGNGEHPAPGTDDAGDDVKPAKPATNECEVALQLITDFLIEELG